MSLTDTLLAKFNELHPPRKNPDEEKKQVTKDIIKKIKDAADGGYYIHEPLDYAEIITRLSGDSQDKAYESYDKTETIKVWKKNYMNDNSFFTDNYKIDPTFY